MKMIWALLGFLHFTQPAYSLSPLQILIDVTPAGGTLKPLPGTYSGPLVIRHAITLDGQEQVRIDAQGEGTVPSRKAPGWWWRATRSCIAPSASW